MAQTNPKVTRNPTGNLTHEDEGSIPPLVSDGASAPLDDVDWRITVGNLSPAPVPSGGLTLPMHVPGSEATHPSVVYVPEGFGGYRYWMVFTPYPAFADWDEDPNVVASHDGTTWVVPAGLTNPLDDQGGSPGAHGSDPVLVHKDGVLYCFWRTNTDSQAGSDRLFYRTSTDGVRWTPTTQFFGPVPGKELVAPAIIFDRGKWMMWVTDNSTRFTNDAGPRPVLLYTADKLQGPWSGPTTCTVPMPSGYHSWHLSVRRVGGQYIMLNNIQTPANYHGSDIIAATSRDGITWQSSGPLVSRIAPHHDHLYHATFVPVMSDGQFGLDVWYGAFKNNGANVPSVWSISRTHIALSWETSFEDTGWVPITTYFNSWVQGEAAYGPVAVRRIGSIIYMRGCIRGGAYGADAFYVPAGFLPAHPREMLVLGYDNAYNIVLCNVAVRLDGGVRVSAAGGAATGQGVVLSTEYVLD